MTKLQTKLDSLVSLLKSEMGGSEADLLDELLAPSEDETRRMNVLNELSFGLSGSQMDLVDEILELDALINPAK